MGASSRIAAVTVSLLFMPLTTGPVYAADTDESLSWGSCRDSSFSSRGFECAHLRVPIAPDAATPGEFSLALVRHPSTGTGKLRIGALVFNPGGPGGSGLQSITGMWAALSTSMQERFDLVSWDPRGVGETTPALAECTVPPLPVPASGPVDWDAVLNAYRPVVAAANVDCATRNSSIVGHVSTMDVVRDLDSIRVALGEEKLTYYGMSYGTRIGYAYALTYPDHVRAIVLDGSIDPTGSVAGFADSATALDQAWQVYARQRPAEAKQFRRALAGLSRTPLPLTSTTQLTRWDLIDAALSSTSSEAAYDWITSFIARVRLAQKGTPAQRKAAIRTLRDDITPPTTGWVTGILPMVQCADYGDRPTPGEQSAFVASAVRKAPLAGGLIESNLALECEGYPASTAHIATPSTPPPAVPMLILGARHDAVTPYAWTQRMSAAFPLASVVTYEGTEHVTWIAGSDCVREIADRFVIRLRPPAGNITCPSVQK